MTGDRNEMNVVSTGNAQCTEVLCLTGGSFRILRVRFGSTTRVGTQDSWKFSNTRPKMTVLEGIQAWEGRASIATTDAVATWKSSFTAGSEQARVVLGNKRHQCRLGYNRSWTKEGSCSCSTPSSPSKLESLMRSG